jgi:5'-nucleotidase
VVLERGLPPGTLLNVNVPNAPAEGIRGAALTRLGKQVYEDSVVRKTDPRGREYYWIAGQGSTWAVEADTDYAAVARGLVSVTPIHLDLTDYRTMDALGGWPLEALVPRGAPGPDAETS